MEQGLNDIEALVREEKRLSAVETQSEAWAEGLSAGIEPEIIAEAALATAFAELVQLSKQAEKSTPSESSTGQLDQLKEYLKKFEQPVDKKQTPGFSFNTENTDASEALEKASKQEKIPQQQDNSAAELELMKKITLMQQQVFADNQSARMFYTSIKVLLPELVKTQGKQVTGWLCNYASVIHAAPHECSEPNLGGEWQFETYTTYDTVYSEH